MSKQMRGSVLPWVMFHLLGDVPPAVRSKGGRNHFGPLDTAMVLSCIGTCYADTFSKDPSWFDLLCLDKLAAQVEGPALFKVQEINRCEWHESERREAHSLPWLDTCIYMQLQNMAAGPRAHECTLARHLNSTCN